MLCLAALDKRNCSFVFCQEPIRASVCFVTRRHRSSPEKPFLAFTASPLSSSLLKLRQCHFFNNLQYHGTVIYLAIYESNEVLTMKWRKQGAGRRICECKSKRLVKFTGIFLLTSSMNASLFKYILLTNDPFKTESSQNFINYIWIMRNSMPDVKVYFYSTLFIIHSLIGCFNGAVFNLDISMWLKMYCYATRARDW